MPPRSPGRPKAAHPKDVKVTVRLTDHEADQLQRLARTGSLSQAIRTALTSYIGMMSGTRGLPDTKEALIRRELRKAKRAGQTEAPALLEAFDLEEAPPPAAEHPRRGPTFTRVPSEPQTVKATFSQVPSEPRVVRVTGLSGPDAQAAQAAAHFQQVNEARLRHAEAKARARAAHHPGMPSPTPGVPQRPLPPTEPQERK